MKKLLGLIAVLVGLFALTATPAFALYPTTPGSVPAPYLPSPQDVARQGNVGKTAICGRQGWGYCNGFAIAPINEVYASYPNLVINSAYPGGYVPPKAFFTPVDYYHYVRFYFTERRSSWPDAAHYTLKNYHTIYHWPSRLDGGSWITIYDGATVWAN